MWIYATGEKCGLRPERIPVSGIEFLHFCEQAGYEMLPIRERHVIALESLPPVHADPFDRILISQARAEALLLLTHDAKLAAYGDEVRLV
jgi:PIN domain nuclease of toxin-antitoxin system